MNILAISGSLQAHSSNSVLIREAAAQQAPDVVVQIFERLGELPHFNPDLDGDFPAKPIAALRNVARAADAVLIASHEYAHEMPGLLKSALDWLVSSGELYGKPAALLLQTLRSAVAGSCSTSG
jgi:chromate reductase, NAD(P)H dehydrogenase (quinone)